MGAHQHGRGERSGTRLSNGLLGGFLRGLVNGIPWGEAAEGEETLLLEVPEKNVVHIHNANGRTAIIGEERDDIEVTATKQARAECPIAAAELIGTMGVSAEEVAGILEIDIEIPRKWNRHGRVALTIRIPNHVQIEVSSANGKVNVCGMRANVHARSDNGSVCIQDVIGDLTLSAANAKVCCEHTCGLLEARSSNGNVELHDHTGGIDAMTSNGSIRASVAKLSEDGVKLATSNGRIVLDLPKDLDAEMDIRVDNGVIRNDRTIDSDIPQSAGRVRGKLGLGGPMIKLRTSNGTVSIH
ncbi:MAG: DUF4097 family beta strand repeat protein [Myxococcales bacterium]|nr:DUF4097 family beta strand repeat protein [Myxococcales bacterium]MCH7868093.1 DUF4097 family beta strand repeat protein [Myxococcales bacterium]